jgi:hypothetical protein
MSPYRRVLNRLAVKPIHHCRAPFQRRCRNAKFRSDLFGGLAYLAYLQLPKRGRIEVKAGVMA